jgi:type IV pilus assembly protein PilQ
MKKICGVMIGVAIAKGAMGYQLMGIEAYDEEGRTVVVITSSDQPQYRVFTAEEPARLIVDFLNAEDSLAKKEIRNRSSVILKISSYQRLRRPVKIVRVVLGLSRLFPYQLLTDANQVILQIETGVVKKEPPEIKEEPKIEPPPKRAILPPLGKIEEAIVPEEEVVEEIEKVGTLSMRFKEADLPDVLRAIAKKIEKNIVVGPDVTGVVNIELKDVSWKQALDMILKIQGYDWVEEDGVIRVDTRENLLRTALKTEVVYINYDKAESMATILSSLLDPEAGGKIITDQRTNSLIITTTPQNLEEMKKVIASLDTPTAQVMIESQLIQIQRSEVENLGIHWGIADDITYRFDEVTGNIVPVDLREEGQTDLIAGEAGGGYGDLVFGRIFDANQLFFRIRSLISTRKAEVIASPKIATSDNQQAVIKIGGEVPYGETTPGAEGGEAGISIEFLEAFTELKVTPKINPNNTVSLDIEIMRKTADPTHEIRVAGKQHTAPTTREQSVKVNVLVKDGETIVIGGMITKDEQIREYRVPLLSELPFVGRLFVSREITGVEATEPGESELFIFLTPHIIN